MNIAVVRKECSLRKGGAERYCANLCRCLAEMGHRVWVLAHECDRDIHPDLIHVPIPVSNRTSAARNLSFHHNSQRALERLKVDRVYALSRTYPADAFRVSDPLHNSWLDMRYTGRFRNRLERLNPRHRTILALENAIRDARQTGVIITNSQWVRNELLACGDYPAERIQVVYNGVDTSLFRPLPSHGSFDAPLKLLFVSHDFTRKGLGFVIEALAELKTLGISCHLSVVGKDDPRAFRKKAERLGVSRDVEFCGPHSDPRACYTDADLLVLPTLSDPFANVCLEALACGLPVMTTTNNGASEILTEGETGYVLDSLRPLMPQIVAGIALFGRLAPERRIDMASRARLCAERFTIELNACRTLEVLAAMTPIERPWHRR